MKKFEEYLENSSLEAVDFKKDQEATRTRVLKKFETLLNSELITKGGWDQFEKEFDVFLDKHFDG